MELLADFRADARVMRHLNHFQACCGCGIRRERLGDTPIGAVVHHRKTGAITEIFRVLELEFDRHAFPQSQEFFMRLELRKAQYTTVRQ